MLTAITSRLGIPWAAHPRCAAGLVVGGFLALMVRPSGALAGAGMEEQAQQVGDGRRTVTNEQLA